MKQLLIIVFILTSSISYGQEIDGVCGLKFGMKQKDFLELEWVKDSIDNQRQNKNSLDVLVKNITINDQKYDGGMFRFYKEDLYCGIIGKTFTSIDSLLQEVNSLKNTIKQEPLFCEKQNNGLEHCLFRDSNDNELFIEATHEKDIYILRLSYYSSYLTTKKKKEEDENRSKNSYQGIQVEVITDKTAN